MPPKFAATPGSYSFSVPPMDIGSGYAAGITQAGKSLSSAISGIMGGVDAQGNVTHGILEQNSTVNDLLGFMHDQGSLTDDAYNSAMSKGLGARQQLAGAYMGQFQTNLKSNIEQQQQLARIQAQGAQEMAQRQAAEAAATERQRMQLEVERQKMLLDPKNRPITITE